VNITDLVGYGATANCFEGAAPSAAPGNSTAIIRNGGGCTDTGNNASDFSSTQPNPRNGSSPFQICSVAGLPVRRQFEDWQTFLSIRFVLLFVGNQNCRDPDAFEFLAKI
jgi:hypothetical protein